MNSQSAISLFRSVGVEHEKRRIQREARNSRTTAAVTRHLRQGN